MMPVRGKAALPVRKSNTVIGLDVFPRRFDVWNYAISLFKCCLLGILSWYQAIRICTGS